MLKAYSITCDKHGEIKEVCMCPKCVSELVESQFERAPEPMPYLRNGEEVAAMREQASENRALDRMDKTAGEMLRTVRGMPGATDPVNHPSHYTAGKVECIDALEAATHDLTGLEAVCTANAIKYLWRWKRKGGHEDLRKARWYINRLLGDTP